MRKIAAVMALMAVLAGGWIAWKTWGKRVLSPLHTRKTGPEIVATVLCTVWFPSRTGLELCEEATTRPKTDDPEPRLRGVIDAMHRGPATPCSMRLFPEDTSPRAVFLAADGTAYLDYPKSVFERPMGLREEFLFVRALGRSIMRNCPEVRSFVLLVDGAPRDFISIHMPAHGKYILPTSPRKK